MNPFLFPVCLSFLLLAMLCIGDCVAESDEVFLESSSGDGEHEQDDKQLSPTSYDVEPAEPAAHSEVDVVDDFLSIVEKYERSKDNCTPGTNYNLGDGVVAQYGVRRFKAQAMVAVNRANFLTRIWKSAHQELLDSEFFFYTSVREMVEGDPVLFAAGNCYDKMQYKDYELFCPYAYRMADNPNKIMVKDLSLEYKYLGNDSEFFYQARMKAERKLALPFNDTYGQLFYIFVPVRLSVYRLCCLGGSSIHQMIVCGSPHCPDNSHIQSSTSYSQDIFGLPVSLAVHLSVLISPGVWCLFRCQK